MIRTPGATLSDVAANAAKLSAAESRAKLSASSDQQGVATRFKRTGPATDVISATTYPLASATGVALEDMSAGTATLVAANSDDAVSAVTSLGFEFWFNGVRYTQYSASANGFVRLGATAATTGSEAYTNNFTNTSANFPLIAPYWDDLYTGATTGKVHAKVVGTAPNRKLVVEWFNMQIPRVGAGSTGAGTFQAWLFETTGKIQFVYGSGIAANSANSGASIGFATSSTVFVSVTASASPTVSYATANNTNTAAIASGTSYSFTPLTPTAPSNLTFTGVTPTQTTLNWADNSSNELGFPVYVSTDNVTFSFLAQAAASATSLTVTGLAPSTTYYYRVYAVTEGTLSAVLAGSQATSAPTVNSSVATGPWSSPSTWSAGTVPVASDAVNISAGNVVTIDVAASAYSVTVAGTLQFEQTTARTLTVGTNVTVQSAGTFQSSAAGSQTGHLLSLGGSLTNNGTLDFSTSGNLAGAGITFTGAAAASFDGTGAVTDVRAITVNKGTSSASILELSPSNFTVRGVATDVASWLTLTNGTLKLSGTFAGTNRVFPLATYSIPATGGFWLNNPNYVVAAQTGNATNNGLLRISQGTFNHGTLASDAVRSGAGAVFTIEGGTVNCAGQFSPQDAVTYNQSGGTLNVAVVGNSGSDFGSFELYSTAAVFNMTGGTINVVQACTGSTQVDFRILGGVTAVGGTVRIGTAATASRFAFTVIGSLPNLVIDNTTNNKTLSAAGTVNLLGSTTINAGSTFVINGFGCFIYGPTFTNNGTLTGTAASTRFYFAGGLGATTYTGTGTVTAPLLAFEVDNAAGVTIAPTANPVATLRVNLFTGSITNANRITLGNGGSTIGTVQIGNSTTATAAGSFDVAPTFNLGSGGQVISYLRTTAARFTGPEVNPARTLATLTIDDNDATHPLTLSGGNLTVTGALTLTNGRVITGANTLVSGSAGSVSRTAGYVDGNLRKTYTATGSKTFEVGTANGYSPVAANATAGTLPADVTVGAKQSVAPFIGAGVNALARYWTLVAPAGLTTNLTFTYLATDVSGNAANYRFVRNASGTVTTFTPSGTPTTTSATLNAATTISGDWTLAEPTPAISIADGATALVDAASTVDFGSSNVGVGVSKTFTVTNTGTADLLLGAITVDGAQSSEFVAGAPGSTTVTAGNSTTFAITFTPTAASARSAAVHVASNVSGATNPFDFLVTGTGVSPNVAPQITSANSTTFQLNAMGSFQVMATGSPAPTFTFTGTLPSGVTLSPAGLLSGTPTAGGSFPITITASNGTPPNATQNFTLIVNRPPVAGADIMSTRRNVAATITVVRLRANDSDPDGDPLTITGVSGASAQGGTVGLASGTVTYTPATNFTGADSFTYQLADGRGGFATGTVSVTVTPGDDQSLRNVSVARDGNGTATVVFAGVPGYAYQVQYQDTMAGPWTNAGAPITADAQGRVTYVDPASPPTRFYRAIAP